MQFPDSSNKSDQPLIKTILEPLLDDFQYWFSQSEELLTSEKATCMVAQEREGLLNRISTAQKEVATARTLLLATAGQAGVEASMVTHWHQLVGQCWQAAQYIRRENA
ncbi:MAG: DUF2605 domain-containing protein [Cyanobacteria bacterium J06638_28]